MKKLIIILIVLLVGMNVMFSEEVKVKTGDVFGVSMLDYFTPVDRSVSGSWSSITSIKKVEKDLWCITLSCETKNYHYPKYFEYYVKPGDIITVYRFPDITKEVRLKIKVINWNEAVVEVIE